jgi:hypothetical protein
VWLTRIAAWLLLVVAIAASGCDFYCSIDCRATCAGLDAARFEAAVATEPELRNVRTTRAKNGVQFDWVRGEAVAYVSMSESEGVVQARIGALNRRPSDSERARWNEELDYLCARLSAACPEIGAWQRADHTNPDFTWAFVIGTLFVAAFVGGVIWLVVRIASPRRAPPAS